MACALMEQPALRDDALTRVRAVLENAISAHSDVIDIDRAADTVKTIGASLDQDFCLLFAQLLMFEESKLRISAELRLGEEAYPENEEMRLALRLVFDNYPWVSAQLLGRSFETAVDNLVDWINSKLEDTLENSRSSELDFYDFDKQLLGLS
jgi:hypothetical protein